MKLSEVKGLKIGTRLRVTNVISGHGYAVGEIINLDRKYNNTTFYSGQWSVRYDEVELCVKDKESIKKEIDTLKNSIKELQAELDYLEEIKSDTYDPTEFKVYQTLKVLNGKKLSEIDKAKVIAKLING